MESWAGFSFLDPVPYSLEREFLAFSLDLRPRSSRWKAAKRHKARPITPQKASLRLAWAIMRSELMLNCNQSGRIATRTLLMASFRLVVRTTGSLLRWRIEWQATKRFSMWDLTFRLETVVLSFFEHIVESLDVDWFYALLSPCLQIGTRIRIRKQVAISCSNDTDSDGRLKVLNIGTEFWDRSGKWLLFRTGEIPETGLHAPELRCSSAQTGKKNPDLFGIATGKATVVEEHRNRRRSLLQDTARDGGRTQIIYR